MNELIKKLADTKNLTDIEFAELLNTAKYDNELFTEADRVRREHYGTDVYVRGLIEITNYCKNNCYYCGIRAGNAKLERYRLSKEDILHCCDIGYELGYRTFVLQGGEDPYHTDEIICDLVSSIKKSHPDCAVTLSLGEKSRESYQAYYDSGADRYLLRHETADPEHYSRLHPASMSCENRKRCLYDLKDIGYQAGAGMMVGAPYQTIENIIEDLRFLQDLQPDMIGIGPFIKHKQTPFAEFENGSFELTVRLLGVLRLMFPYVLLPATTALGTIHPFGRELGMKAGANVVMPNLSPSDARKLYTLYENKIHSGDESADHLNILKKKAASVGYNVVTDIGHVKK